jgi:hypothetical protein
MKIFLLFIVGILLVYCINLTFQYKECQKFQEGAKPIRARITDDQFRTILLPEDESKVMIDLPVIEIEKETKILKGNVVILVTDKIDTMILTESLILKVIDE